MSLLEVKDLRTWFASPEGPVHAVDGVSLTLEQGETLGVVGESGSGKSALLRSILGLLDEAHLSRYEGRVTLNGQDLRALSSRRLTDYLGRRISIVFQNPQSSLNPVVPIGRQITESLERHLGMGGPKARRRGIELLEEVGMPEPARRFNQFPHELSGGMQQRVTIAIALSCGPAVLLADEPTTALDVTVQAQILDLLRELQKERGMAMLFVTHDLGVVAGLAERIAVMYAGRVVETGSTADVIERPRMPYTAALIAASPRLEYPSQTALPVIPGRPPSLVGGFIGCPFAPRCQYQRERCERERPYRMESEASRRRVACWYPVNSTTGSGEATGSSGSRSGMQ